MLNYFNKLGVGTITFSDILEKSTILFSGNVFCKGPAMICCAQRILINIFQKYGVTLSMSQIRGNSYYAEGDAVARGNALSGVHSLLPNFGQYVVHIIYHCNQKFSQTQKHHIPVYK